MTICFQFFPLLTWIILSRVSKSQVYDAVPNGENSVIYDVPINSVSLFHFHSVRLNVNLIPYNFCRTLLGT